MPRGACDSAFPSESKLQKGFCIPKMAKHKQKDGDGDERDREENRTAVSRAGGAGSKVDKAVRDKKSSKNKMNGPTEAAEKVKDAGPSCRGDWRHERVCWPRGTP